MTYTEPLNLQMSSYNNIKSVVGPKWPTKTENTVSNVVNSKNIHEMIKKMKCFENQN